MGNRVFKSETNSATVVCPSCGTHNKLTAAHLPSQTSISCSHCGAELGLWGDLINESGETTLCESGPAAGLPLKTGSLGG